MMDGQETIIPPAYPTSPYGGFPSDIEAQMLAQAEYAQQQQVRPQTAQEELLPEPDMRAFSGPLLGQQVGEENGQAYAQEAAGPPQASAALAGALQGQFRRGINIGGVAGLIGGCVLMYILLVKRFPAEQENKGKEEDTSG